MKVAVAYFDETNTGRTSRVAKALATGLEEAGHRADLLDIKREGDRKLTMYDYVCLGAPAPGMFGVKVPDALDSWLAQSGAVTGKRCYAFSVKGGLRTGRFLLNIMKIMEREGMYLKRSDILSDENEARAVGTRLHVNKSTGA